MISEERVRCYGDFVGFDCVAPEQEVVAGCADEGVVKAEASAARNEGPRRVTAVVGGERALRVKGEAEGE